jgi:uncharacterized membrane protein YphA (DoxX/SURF4 family)
MDQNVSPPWYRISFFGFRVLSLYLILVFLFISSYLDDYGFLGYFNKPFHYVTLHLTHGVGTFFLKKQLTAHLEFRDYYWTYIALFVYLLIAVIIAIAWIIIGKEKKSAKLFTYTTVFARYYLASLLLNYGISKIFGDQFGHTDLSTLIQPFGNIDPHRLFWEFMGASKSYQIFGGVLEVTAGSLLLFRRTTTIGCLIALALFINILMLDIAFDTFVKVRLFYFILLTIYILSPDIKRLFSIFILKQSASLSFIPPIIENKKYKPLHYILKFGLIGLVFMVIIKKQMDVYSLYHYPSHGSISGIYKISEFYLNHQLRLSVNDDSVCWEKIAINKYFPIAGVQLANDSFTEYYFKVDTIKKLIDLSLQNHPLFKSRLHYSHTNSDQWLFEGSFKNDSIRFTSKKVDIKNFNLEKGYGKTIWDYDF